MHSSPFREEKKGSLVAFASLFVFIIIVLFILPVLLNWLLIILPSCPAGRITNAPHYACYPWLPRLESLSLQLCRFSFTSAVFVDDVCFAMSFSSWESILKGEAKKKNISGKMKRRGMIHALKQDSAFTVQLWEMNEKDLMIIYRIFCEIF